MIMYRELIPLGCGRGRHLRWASRVGSFGEAARYALALALAGILLIFSGMALADETAPQQWRMLELKFSAARDHAFPVELDLSVAFVGPRGVQIDVPGFWDGGNTWRVRFVPPSAGDWHYETSEPISGDPGLDKQSGTFTVAPAGGDNPLFAHGGFLRVSANGRYLTYSDGTPFFWLADTWWFCPSAVCPIQGPVGPDGETMFKELVDTRKREGFTVAQMAFASASNEFGSSMFRPSSWKEFDIRFWRRADQYFAYATDSGILPAVGVGFASGLDKATLSDLKLLWRYIVARYGAYAGTWLVTGEYNKNNEPARVAKFLALGQYIKDLDPYKRAMSIHPWTYGGDKRQVWDQPWYDFVMLQSGHKNEHFKGGPPPESLYLDIYRRKKIQPLLEDECDYEGIKDIDADRVRLVAYRAIQSGSFGYTYGVHGVWVPITSLQDRRFNQYGPPVLWWQALAKEGGRQMGYLRRAYELVDWWKLEPAPNAVKTPAPLPEALKILVKAEDHQAYVIYFPKGLDPAMGAVLEKQAAGTRYGVTWFNPRNGESHRLANGLAVASDQVSLPPRPDGQDWVLILKRSSR